MAALSSSRRLWFLTAALLCAPALASASDAKKDPNAIGARKVSAGLNFYSLRQEMAMGRQLAIEVEKQARMVDDPIIAEYINRIGQNLVRNSDVKMPVTFRVIESDEINAFTLPGGYIFINTGLIRLSANEAQLAAAMAHELGHTAGRHATRQASRNELMAFGTLPFSLLGRWRGLMIGPVAPMTFMRVSRKFETDADLLGLEYLWKAGYDPTASVDLFEAMASTEKRQPGRIARLFRTHPVTAERIDRTQKNIDRLLPAREDYVLNTSEYEEMRARLLGSGSEENGTYLRGTRQ
jgi:predicted Zn-dependent protease